MFLFLIHTRVHRSSGETDRAIPPDAGDGAAIKDVAVVTITAIADSELVLVDAP